ncbi:O-antigen ligase family protein [Aequorivita sp. Q41]|uniref:O-antigen ligase family protein n=1 Tax=Aequorivita sp. Q41 TaxID=3153300 RepID=UPI003241F8E3
MRILLSAIYPYAFMLLYLIIPFDDYFRAPPNILMGILVVAFPFIVRKEDFKKLKSLPIAIFLGFFAYLCINSLISGRGLEDFTTLKKVIIAVGLAILYIPIADVKKINNAIIFSSLAAILFSVYNFVLITDATGSFALGESPQVIESLLIDRLYLGLLSTFSILISFQAIQKKYHPNNNYYLANIFVNALFIILISSKIAVIALCVLLLVRQFYGQRKIWKAIIGIVAIVAVVGLFFLLKNENGFQTNYENHKTSPPTFIQNSMTYELRAVIWSCAQNVITNEGFSLTGIGLKATEEKLAVCYESTIANPTKKEQFVSARYNTHNQFLDFYLSAGFLALLFFTTFIVVNFFAVRKQFFPTAMLTILVLYCLVENLFHRQIGAYYTGFILIILLTSVKPNENNTIKNK